MEAAPTSVPALSGSDTSAAVDGDGDGLVDFADTCPEAAGTITNFGCPEAGISSMMSGESSAASPAQNDSDRDGIYGTDDACPNEFGYWPFSGCKPTAAQMDSDHDGFSDAQDTCPLQAAPGGDGCPAGQGGGASVDTLSAPVQTGDCSGSLPSRLAVGQRGRIASVFSTLRDAPFGFPTQVIYAPATFTVLEGPVCSNTFAYYRIDYGNGATGWALESEREGIYGSNRYWLEPAS